MSRKIPEIITVKLDSIVGGGQTISSLEDGRKLFVWGGLPGETVKVKIIKKKSKLAEAIVVEVLEPSPDRVEPRDQDSYLSTSPWQIMSYDLEQTSKAHLVKLAFGLHKIELPEKVEVISDEVEYNYRNKMEFAWYWNKETEQIDLAFFRRGSNSKAPITTSNLAKKAINQAAGKLKDLLRQQALVKGMMLKSLIVRCDQKDNIIMQLYVKNEDFPTLPIEQLDQLDIKGLEVIFSNPQSPASVITKKLQIYGDNQLTDNLLGIDFNYCADSFFQVNLPVYQMALKDIKDYLLPDKSIIDLYSGVGTIGLSITSNNLKLVEINDSAVREMRENIKRLNKTAEAILAPSQEVVNIIDDQSIIIVDPPRAGLDQAVIDRLNDVKPPRIIYLSCNPVTQARDIANLSQNYIIKCHKAYNFFPKTPHIEHLVILDKKT